VRLRRFLLLPVWGRPYGKIVDGWRRYDDTSNPGAFSRPDRQKAFFMKYQGYVAECQRPAFLYRGPKVPDRGPGCRAGRGLAERGTGHNGNGLPSAAVLFAAGDNITVCLRAGRERLGHMRTYGRQFDVN
jgi:hypothetical protein